MKVLDIDMDYFMDKVETTIPDNIKKRLSEKEFGEYVWSESRIRDFLENHLGLSKQKKLKGRIVKGHNETLYFWKELIENRELDVPFEVIHVDSHADLGLGYDSYIYIYKKLLSYNVMDRPKHNTYRNVHDKIVKESIGDYLLFAIAYRWISKLTYCANIKGDTADYDFIILKDFNNDFVFREPVDKIIQLLYNPDMKIPYYDTSKAEKEEYINFSQKEPEVPFQTIPTVRDVNFVGDFDYVSMAQSPNYTPASADFIMEIFKEYIVEI